MGAITLFPLYLFELLQTGFNQSFNFRSMIGILYGGLFSSTLGYLFYNYGAKHIKAEEIGIFTLLEPIATALVAIPLLGEKITFTYLLGSVIVFLGIFVAEVRLHYHPFHHFYKNLKTDQLANSQSSVKKDDA